MFKCPICGDASNRKGRPFESRDAVVKHIGSKNDLAHTNVDPDEFREDIEELDRFSLSDVSEDADGVDRSDPMPDGPNDMETSEGSDNANNGPSEDTSADVSGGSGFGSVVLLIGLAVLAWAFGNENKNNNDPRIRQL